MNYIGTDPREGAKVIASSDISSTTATVTFDSIFDTNSMYFLEIAHYLSDTDVGTGVYTWRNGGSDDGGNSERSTQYVSVNSSRYGASDVNTDDTESYNSQIGNHSGDVSALETGGASSWFVPNTTNEKYFWSEAIGWNPVTEMLSLQMNSSYSDATAQDGIKIGDSAGNIDQANIRIYKYPEHRPSVMSLKQTLPNVSFVKPKYIGQIRSGKGMVHLGTYTAAGGEAYIDFDNIFTSSHERYYFYLTNCRPATDDKNLEFHWKESDGTVNSSATNYMKGYRKMDSNGSSGSGFSNAQNNANIMYNVGSDNDETGHLYAWCDNPATANLGKALRFRSIHQRSGESGRDEMTRFLTGVIMSDTTTAYTSCRFVWDSGNWEAGTITIYGWQE